MTEGNEQRLAGLERSRARDWVRIAPGATVERIEARFGGHAYAPHRHDTMAFGLTLEGVQSFRFRGAERHSLRGNVIVLPPDELHDGHAGTEDGFRYRMLYLDPEAIREAAGGALPHVTGGALDAPRLASALAPGLADLETPLDPLAEASLVADLADALREITRAPPRRRPPPVDEVAVRRVKAMLLETLEDGVPLAALEEATGLSRHALHRHFKAACGVAPHRWLVMRRLDRARAALLDGASLAEAALGAGFADQSHMTRHFKAAFGMSPGAWRGLFRSGSDVSTRAEAR
jgi:AraC-like DNA-binding protein